MSTESQKKDDKSKKDPDKNVSVNTEKDTGKSSAEHVVSLVKESKKHNFSNNKLSELIKKHITKTKEKLEK